VERTIWWDGDDVAVLDQTRLPLTVAVVRWRTLGDAVHGIKTMQVRGAPLLGVAAAHGLALAARADPSDAGLAAAADQLRVARPTAVNVAWALRQALASVLAVPPPDRAELARTVAERLAEEDAAVCAAIGAAGLAVLETAAARRLDRPVQILTHCNAGRLACIEHGTATAPVYLAFERGLPVHVWVSETRPRNQGAALTAWELGDRGVPHTVIADNAAGYLLATGAVDVCLVGADRVAANGDVANKVGTYLKALAAVDNGVPFYAVLPTSTVDHASATGADIPIEERDPSEVTTMAGVALVPPGTAARNWAFDVTPARLVSGLVTERGVVAATPEGVASLR
jgi:methylthioribose-1-phosphate isomerase